MVGEVKAPILEAGHIHPLNGADGKAVVLQKALFRRVGGVRIRGQDRGLFRPQCREGLQHGSAGGEGRGAAGTLHRLHARPVPAGAFDKAPGSAAEHQQVEALSLVFCRVLLQLICKDGQPFRRGAGKDHLHGGKGHTRRSIHMKGVFHILPRHGGDEPDPCLPAIHSALLLLCP